MDELERHLDDLRRVLPDVNEDDLRRALQECVDFYKLEWADAKMATIRKFGGDPASLVTSRQRKIGELVPYEVVEFRAKVIAINSRTLLRNREERTIYYGILADETGSIPFTAWADFNLRKGDVVHIRGAFVREWAGNIKLNLSENARVEKLDQDLEVKLGSDEILQIGTINSKTSSCSVMGRVLSLEEATITLQDGQRTVYRGVIADRTGKISFTSWVPLPCDLGQAVIVRNAYVRIWRGLPQLNINESSDVEVIESADLPSVEELSKCRSMRIEEVAERGGASQVMISGVVVDVKGGSGLIFRCPECKRVLQRSNCMVHGRVEGIPDLRIKAVVDDGTGSMTAIFQRDLTEKVLGKSLKECQDEAKEKMDFNVITDQVVEKVLARPVEIRGDVTSDEFGLMMIVQDVSFPGIDPVDMASKILSRLEELA